MSAVEFWQGEFGDEYQKRNGFHFNSWTERCKLWQQIMECLGDLPRTHPDSFHGSVLEIGAGTGQTNLEPLLHLGYSPLWGVEPNATARAELTRLRFGGFDGTAANPGRTADLVFTSGVLIHIPPDELLAACRGIYGAAQRYIVCIEYFSSDPEEKEYRGHEGKLWKRDFGGFWLDHFNLEPLGYGFSWKRMTGLDNLTWHVFRKC